MKNKFEECNHTIRCLNAKCVGGRIQTTMRSDDGYSDWTVLDSGFIEFKCHGCGKFASTDEDKLPNEIDNFEIVCKKCGSREWESYIALVEDTSRTHIVCKKCGVKTYKLKQR